MAEPSIGERIIAQELSAAEQQLTDALLNNAALARVIHQMQLEQEALERKWQRERVGRELERRKRQLGLTYGAASDEQLTASKEAALALRQQAALLQATQERRMQLMSLRLSAMHEQLSATSLRVSEFTGAPADDGASSTAHETPQVETSPQVADWAELTSGG